MGESSDEEAYGPDRDFFDDWVNKNYGTNCRTKTVTFDKHHKICSMLHGHEIFANAKFRFWVRSKDFVLLSSNGIEIQAGSEQEGKLYIKIREAACPHSSSSHLSQLQTQEQNINAILLQYRKVAIVEEFYQIIRAVHVDSDGIHSGQKKTYRMVSDEYCFLPREVVTFYLLHCKKCRPRIEKYGPLASKRKWEEMRHTTTNSYLNEDKEHEGLEYVEGSDISGHDSPSTFEAKDSSSSDRYMKSGTDYRNYGRKLSYSRETDEKLLRWVQDQTSLGETVTKDKLKEQALAVVQLESPDFKASNGWLEKFLTRHGIVLSSSRHVQSHFLVNSPVPVNGNDNETRRNGTSPHTERTSTPSGDTAVTEGLIKEPPHLTELMQQVNTQSAPNSVGSSASMKDEDEDNDDDDDDDQDPDDIPNIRRSGGSSHPINPERLKAFNMFVRLFVDENLDRLVPISKQPKDKIGAIIISCQRQFPEFGERARKRIRTYLKSCRRSSRLREPMKRTAEHISMSTAHIPSTQLSEVNNILAKACHNESHEAAKRSRIDTSPGRELSSSPNRVNAPVFGSIPPLNPIHQQGRLPLAIADSSSTPVKLSPTEVAAVRQLITGYRESGAFLYRSAEELENLLRRSESHYNNQ